MMLRYNPDWVVVRVFTALEPHLSNIRLLELKRVTTAHLPLLRGVSNLKQLGLSAHNLPAQDNVGEAGRGRGIPFSTYPINDVVERSSSTLSSCSIAFIDFYADTTKVRTIQQIMLPPKATPLKVLTSLKLKLLCPVLYSSTPTLPQLTSLQSLNLNLECAVGTGRDMDSAQARAATDLWDALRNTHIRLRSIVCAYVTGPFLKYLASYEGVLEELEVKDSWNEAPRTSKAYAGELFTSALPSHKSSLRSLDIVPSLESDWYLGQSNVECIVDTWPELVDLVIGVKVYEGGLTPHSASGPNYLVSF